MEYFIYKIETTLLLSRLARVKKFVLEKDGDGHYFAIKGRNAKIEDEIEAKSINRPENMFKFVATTLSFPLFFSLFFFLFATIQIINMEEGILKLGVVVLLILILLDISLFFFSIKEKNDKFKNDKFKIFSMFILIVIQLILLLKGLYTPHSLYISIFLFAGYFGFLEGIKGYILFLTDKNTQYWEYEPRDSDRKFIAISQMKEN